MPELNLTKAIQAGNAVAKPYKHTHNTQQIVEAALPHIREQLAQEIRALILNPANSNTPHCVEEYNAGLQNAAELLEEHELSQTPDQTKALAKGQTNE